MHIDRPAIRHTQHAYVMRRTLFLALVLLVGRAHAAALGVTDAWQAALQHDPQFAAALAQREAGRTHAAQGRALWLPTLTGQASAGRADQQSSTSGAAFSAPGFPLANGVDFLTRVNQGTAWQWAIVAEQPLYDRGRMVDTKTHDNAAMVADVQFVQARQDLLLRTVRSYFAVIHARTQLVAMQRLHAAAEQARAAAQARYESGDSAVTDAREAQASADAISVQELDARSAVALAEADFSALTGLEPIALRDLPASEPQDFPATEPLAVWTQRASAGNPTLAMQRLAVATASAQVDRYSAQASARLSLVAKLGRESLQGSGDYGAADVTGRHASIAVQAVVPLFTGGLRSAQQHEARALEHKAKADLEVAEQRVQQDVRSAWLTLNTTAARVRALQRLHRSSQDRVSATRLGTEVGNRTVLELLNAQAAWLGAGTELQMARSELLLTQLQLTALAGELSDSDVRRIDDQLIDRPAGAL